MRQTFHLVPVATWTGSDADRPYVAPSLESEGFIHCTDGHEALIDTANRHYRDDPRPFVALTIDLERVGSPYRVEDPAGIYPHVFGPIDRSAIIGTAPLLRDDDGEFVGLGAAAP